jgi:LytS/YehU family sensor histidine kinase
MGKAWRNRPTRWILALATLPLLSLVVAIRSHASTPELVVWILGDLGLLAAILALAHSSHGRRVREQEWTADRLHVLEAQLHPHFLFNTLNSIATLMHEDVDAADEMMAKLATLLRRTLNRNGAYEIPLKEELEILEIYLDIQRTRFEDRLSTVIDADPTALDAMVPRLILQPLVENAVRHGISRRTGPGRIEVRAWRDAGTLKMTVLNDGAGWDPRDTSGAGLGLANTRARLAEHFQNRYQFDLREAGDGGAIAEISVPMKPCVSAH